MTQPYPITFGGSILFSNKHEHYEAALQVPLPHPACDIIFSICGEWRSQKEAAAPYNWGPVKTSRLLKRVLKKAIERKKQELGLTT